MDRSATKLRRDLRGLVVGDWFNGLAALPVLILLIALVTAPGPFPVVFLGLSLAWLLLRNSGRVRLTEETLTYGTRLRRRTLPRRDVVRARTGRTTGFRGVQLLGIDLVLHDGSIEHLRGSVNQGIPRHRAWIEAINEWVPPPTTRARAEVFLLPTHAVIAAGDLTAQGEWLRSDRIQTHRDVDAESIGESIEACLARSQVGVEADTGPAATPQLLQLAECDSWHDLIATSEHVVVLKVADQHVVIRHRSTTTSPQPFSEVPPRSVVPVGDTVALGSAVLACSTTGL